MNKPIASADFQPDTDEGMPPMSERLRRSAANMAMLAALPPKPEPTEAVARADDAVRGLIAPLLTDPELQAISRDHGRCEREGRLL